MKRAAWVWAAAAGALCLPGCQRHSGASDLVSRVLFTATGSYDRSADQRSRQGQGIRQVVWQSRPPLPAQAVSVRYDSDQRLQGWQMEVQRPGFTLAALNDGSLNGVRQVQTARGQVTVLSTPRLKDVVTWQTGDRLMLETRGFVVQHDPELGHELGAVWR